MKSPIRIRLFNFITKKTLAIILTVKLFNEIKDPFDSCHAHRIRPQHDDYFFPPSDNHKEGHMVEKINCFL